MEADKNPFPRIDLLPRLHKIGRSLSRLILGPHLFASHGDHFVGHPFDSDLYDTPQQEFEWPLESDGIQYTVRECPDLGRDLEA